VGVHLHAIDQADSRPLFDPAHAVPGDHDQLRRPGHHRHRRLQPAKDLGIDAVTLGYIFSAFGWAYVAGQIPGGWLLDRFGSKKSMP
jgi:MFS family permease